MNRLFILLFIFVSCNNANESANKSSADSTSTVSNVTMPGPQAVKIPGEQLPASIKFRGTLNEAWQWKDKLGENILVTAIVPPYWEKKKSRDDEDVQSAELHAFHFVKKDSAYKLLWKTSDAEKECPFDLTTAFVKDAITITDLDEDGIAETKIQYRLSCRSDVSPSYMKLIIHEDTAKYSLRGAMWVQLTEKDSFVLTETNVNLENLPKKDDEYDSFVQGIGRYENEKEFSKAPAAFLEYARREWVKYVKESFE